MSRETTDTLSRFLGERGGMSEFEAVVTAVGERVTPDEEERARLERIVDELRSRAEAAVADLPVDADVLLVGSTARGTWLAGDRDVDLFVRFPQDLPRDDLEAYGLEVGHAVLPDGHEEYAEHPYVTGEYEGVAIDLVPCYDVAAASDVRSAVDRTPFHAEYLDGRLTPGLAAEVRVAKAFLRGIGAYGSDLRTRGFSGYLTELLVCEFGGFREVVTAAADWEPPVRLDPAAHGDRRHDDPLVVVDPTDPGRNVAAAVSARNVARLVHYARDLLDDPRQELFEPRRPTPLSEAAIREEVRERGTTPVAIRFDAPDVVEDQLYPQLDKSLAGLEGELERRGFEPLRSVRFADDTAVLFVECAVAALPAVERHDGPPIGVREHAEAFHEAYHDADVYGPFLDGDRYAVERDREFRTAAALCEGDVLFDVSLGPHVERALAGGYDVLAGEDVAVFAGEFGEALAAYFDPLP